MVRLSEEQPILSRFLKNYDSSAKSYSSPFYTFPLTVEAPLIPFQESISIYEPTTAEEQSDQSYYHPFIFVGTT